MLTGVTMPEMNGWELAQEFTKQRPDMKVIFMSAYAQDVLDAGTAEGQHIEFPKNPRGRHVVLAHPRTFGCTQQARTVTDVHSTQARRGSFEVARGEKRSRNREISVPSVTHTIRILTNSATKKAGATSDRASEGNRGGFFACASGLSAQRDHPPSVRLFDTDLVLPRQPADGLHDDVTGSFDQFDQLGD